jgi:hypothetical protein
MPGGVGGAAGLNRPPYPDLPTHAEPVRRPFLRRIGMAPEQLAAIKFDVKLPN